MQGIKIKCKKVVWLPGPTRFLVNLKNGQYQKWYTWNLPDVEQENLKIKKHLDEKIDASLSDVDFENKTMSITKSRTGTYKSVTMLVTTPKTNASNRVIPLTDEIIAELTAERERQKADRELFGNAYMNGYDFIIRNKLGKPYTNLSCVDRVVTRLMDKAGLRHCTIHGLRHTVASILDDNGVPIQEISALLGHENIKTTENIYIHRSRTVKRANISLLDTAYKNNGAEKC